MTINRQFALRFPCFSPKTKQTSMLAKLQQCFIFQLENHYTNVPGDFPHE